MTKSEASELVQTFVEEHRTLMRGLAGVLEKVEAANLAAARNMADELDHMNAIVNDTQQIVRDALAHGARTNA